MRKVNKSMSKTWTKPNPRRDLFVTGMTRTTYVLLVEFLFGNLVTRDTARQLLRVLWENLVPYKALSQAV